MAQRYGAGHIARQHRHAAAEVGGQTLRAARAADEHLRRLTQQDFRLLAASAGQQGGQTLRVVPQPGHALPGQHAPQRRRQHRAVEVQDQQGVVFIQSQQQGVDGLRGETVKETVLVGQAAEIVLHKLHAVQRAAGRKRWGNRR